MNKKKVLLLTASVCTMVMLSGCSQLHVHDYSGPYEFNETEHWQICPKCQEKINLESHSYNQLTDTCLICKYQDPICVSNEDHHMTGLTKHGKTKFEVNVSSGITFIDNGAFKDSEAKTVNLTKDIIGIYKDAFTGSKVNVVNTEEEIVTWVEYEGIYYKNDILKNYEALIDKVPYKTLEEAFKNVEKDDVTITLLRDKYSIGTPVEINHTITLETYTPSATLEANFNIGPNGWLKIPSSVTYSGHTKLLLADATELCGDKLHDVYSTGSLVFVKKGEKPENVKVSYVKTYEAEEEKDLKPVKGHKQIVNEALLIPYDYYIYGTFLMSKDFKTIYGLTPFAKNISNLTITSLIENDDTIVDLADFSFNYLGRMDIDIGIKKITVRAQIQKGAFHYLTIDDHIGKLGISAFSTRISHDSDPEMRKILEGIVAPLYEVTLGENVFSIEEKCFEDCANITKVVGGKGLKHVAVNSFESCFNLKEVDFSNCLELNFIGWNAFQNDLELKNVKLPYDGWDIDGHGYLPTDMTPELTAHYLVNIYRDKNWKRTLGGTVCLYNPNEKDVDGRCNRIKYYPDLSSALSKASDGNHIYLTDKAQKEYKDAIISHQLYMEAAPNQDFKFTGTLTIDKGKFFIIDKNISMETNEVIIKNNDNSGNQYKNQAGFAMERSSNEKNPSETKVTFNGHTAIASIAKINDKDYNAWGLYNFEVRNGTGDENKVIIINRAPLGTQFTDLIIDQQVLESPEEAAKRFIWVNDKAFYHLHDSSFKSITLGDNVIHINNYAFEACYNLTKVVFGKNIRWIGTKAFFTCKNLVDVDFTNSSDLNEFGENSFAECYNLTKVVLCKEKNLPLYGIKDRAFEKTNLQEFDLGPSYQGWKHNGTVVGDDICQNPNAFADYLRSKYPTHNFTR